MSSLIDWALSCPAPVEFISTVFLVLAFNVYLLSLTYPTPEQLDTARSAINGKKEGTKIPRKELGVRKDTIEESNEDVWEIVSRVSSVSLPLLLQLRSAYRSRYTTYYRIRYPDIKKDPYLPCRLRNEMTESCLLCRFLKAALNERKKKPVEEAMKRMDEVVEYRKDYSCNDFHHTPGMGKELYNSPRNPGSEMYFADSLLKDVNGCSYIVGRLQVCNDDVLDPPNHLRAAMLCIDRMACELLHRGVVNDQLPKASYILDLTDLPPNFQATHSGTGYGENVKKQNKNKGVILKRVNEMGTTPPSKHIGVKPHLPSHYKLKSGTSCLKEALRLLTGLYPELLDTIYFYNTPWWFHPIFKIFSLWVRKETRQKFVFVKKGAGAEAFKRTIGVTCLSGDFGGTADTHGIDEFLKNAIEKYDAIPEYVYAGRANVH